MERYFHIYFNLKQHFSKMDFRAFSLCISDTDAIYDRLKNKKVYEIGIIRAMKNYPNLNVFEDVCVANILFNPKFFISDFFQQQNMVQRYYDQYRKYTANPDYFIRMDEVFLVSLGENYDIINLYDEEKINFYTMLKCYTETPDDEKYKYAKYRVLLDKFILYRYLAQERTQ